MLTVLGDIFRLLIITSATSKILTKTDSKDNWVYIIIILACLL